MRTLTKSEAERECVRLWRELPRTERASSAQAEAFAAVLLADIDFPTSSNRYHFIRGWLQNDLRLRGTL
jgi:hypothetical protein